VLINIIGIAMMGRDKMTARAGAWRIPEGNLILVALLGGSVGVILGVKLFRHKTRHIKFAVGVPLIFFLQLAVVLWLFH